MSKKHRPKPNSEPSWRYREGILWDLPRVVKIRVWDLVIQIESPGGVPREHFFQFARKPSLEDFLAVCLLLPWTSVWDETIIPAMIACKWPELQAGYKRAEVALPNVGPNKPKVRVTIQTNHVWSSIWSK